ncbi:hypothetical protein [Microbacterium sp.]|uniref:hypothetical protein n=1 Tax=Microbacterium sp. TaxID=51671 RepID=UPI0026377D49|nr:hypothetical protein [Microbacterium sp.]
MVLSFRYRRQRISIDAKHPRATGVEAEYLALLDHCLLDRVISVSEAQQLASAAEEFGLSRFEVEGLHTEYCRALVQVAWADGVLTEDERNDLAAVAELLQVADASTGSATESGGASTGSVAARATGGSPTTTFTLSAGDLIVLTGDYGIPIVTEDGLTDSSAPQEPYNFAVKI